MLRDRAFVADLLARARAAGCAVLVLTVDLPMPGLRYRDYKTGLVAPSGLRGRLIRGWLAAQRPGWLWNVGVCGRPHSLGNLAPVMRDGKAMGGVVEWIAANYDPSIDWSDLAFLRDHWDGPLIVKGIMHPADAEVAREAGADAVLVSNHGGRQLDGAGSTASMLPSIRERVGADFPVFVDGGARTGTDVLRFMTLGADAVWLGRAWAYALAAGGEAGVAMLLQRIATELRIAKALSGAA
jgi:L-lactate dehydrogenase (cytochrome)